MPGRMARRVLYVAAPHHAPSAAERTENRFRGLRWLLWLRAAFPDIAFTAPWITILASLDDNYNLQLRKRVLIDELAVVGRCDGVVLCGGRVADGMHRKRVVATDAGGDAINITRMGPAPPVQAYRPDLHGRIVGLS